MIDFLKRYNTLVIMVFVWLFTGIYLGGQVTIILIPLCVLLLKIKNRHKEMFLGFLFLLAMSDSWSYSMGWARDVRNIYMLMLATFYFLDMKQYAYPSKIYLYFLPFLVWTFIVNFRNADPGNAFQKSLSYSLVLIIIPVYLKKILTEDGIEFLRDIGLFVGWLLMAGFILYPFMYDLVTLVGRYRGVLGNPNGIGTFSYVFITFFFIVNSKFPELLTKQEKITIYGLIFTSLIFSVSRNGLMSIIIFFLFARFYRLSPFAGFALLVVLIVVFQIISQNITGIINGIGLGTVLRASSIENGSGRVVAWTFAWGFIQKDIFIGRGFDYDGQLFMEYKTMLGYLGHNGGVHNVFLGLWLCFGLIGVVLFYQALFRVIFKAAHSSYLAVPLLYGAIFSTSFEAWLMGSLNPFTVYFIMSLFLLSYDPETATEEKSLVPV
ncbi:MAG: O-antigen ligase family protein [Bacteroidia bacterium]